MAHALLEDGTEIPLKDEELTRLLYALTSLAVTSLAPVQNCRAIIGGAGEVLWEKANTE